MCGADPALFGEGRGANSPGWLLCLALPQVKGKESYNPVSIENTVCFEVESHILEVSL